MKIVVYTLGCKVNQYESDSLIRTLKGAGHEVTTKLEYADVYVVNSCAVTSTSEQKSRQTIGKINKLNPVAKIIVTGCASQNNPDQFKDKENVKLVTGLAGKHLIPGLLNTTGEKVLELPSVYEDKYLAMPTRTRATLKVQDGCDNFCSYCLIPYLRGRSRSRDLSSIIKEAKMLAEFTNEIVITGINTSDYKINNELALGDLMLALKDIKARLRISSLEVNIITDEFLEKLKSMENFAPHFHLSLQSGSNNTLKAMGRKYTAREYLQKVKLIRKYFKNASVTTDLIVGFSTETKKDFKKTLKTIKKAKFFDIHIFPYSKRKGTKAYNLPLIDKKTVKKRLEKIKKRKLKGFNKYIRKNKHTIKTALIEQVYSGYQIGHTENFIKVYIIKSKNISEGEFVKVKLVKAFKDGMLAQEYIKEK
jgi:threonylcarbamoyladenosine tRNA methylthiotransferase MtaB